MIRQLLTISKILFHPAFWFLLSIKQREKQTWKATIHITLTQT